MLLFDGDTAGIIFSINLYSTSQNRSTGQINLMAVSSSHMLVSIGTGQSKLSQWHPDPWGGLLKTKLYEGGAITLGQIKRWDVLVLCVGGLPAALAV